MTHEERIELAGRALKACRRIDEGLRAFYAVLGREAPLTYAELQTAFECYDTSPDLERLARRLG